MQTKTTHRPKYTTRERLTVSRLYARNYGGTDTPESLEGWEALSDSIHRAAVAVSQLMRIERKLRRHYTDAANGWPKPIRETRWDYTVSRDGRILGAFDTHNAAFAWLLGHQPHSVDHATTHEGYTIKRRQRVFNYDVEDTARRARSEVATAKLEARAAGIADEFGFEIRINTDPRGAAIKLNLIPQPNPSAADSIEYAGMDTDLLCDDARRIEDRNSRLINQ